MISQKRIKTLTPLFFRLIHLRLFQFGLLFHLLHLIYLDQPFTERFPLPRSVLIGDMVNTNSETWFTLFYIAQGSTFHHLCTLPGVQGNVWKCKIIIPLPVGEELALILFGEN